MQVRIHDEGVSITASGLDAYVFATRPGIAWPVSELSRSRVDFTLDFDKHGDLVGMTDILDKDGVPIDAPSNEVTAFAEYALTLAHVSLGKAIEQQQTRYR
jgi:hypothetical protein